MRIFSLLVLLCLSWTISARIRDKYCGTKNCYAVLNVSQDASQQEVKKSYRTLSLKYHPDKNPGKDTTPIYREINQAYEILSNEDLRNAYNEYLENPHQNEYYQYYRFYKAVYAPSTDPRLVFGLFVSLFSILQYFARKSMYKSAVSQVERTTKFQTLVNQRMEEEKALNSNKAKEDIIKELRETVQIHGGYSPPKIKDLLAFKILLLPYSIVMWFYRNIRWIVLFTIMNKPYGPEEKEYLTMKRLGLSEARWNVVPESEREAYIGLELWDKDNFAQYMKEMQERQREMLASSSKYKQYQRYMKNKKR